MVAYAVGVYSTAYLIPSKYKTIATTTPDATETKSGNRNLSRQAFSDGVIVTAPPLVSSGTRRRPLSAERRTTIATLATMTPIRMAMARMNKMFIASLDSYSPLECTQAARPTGTRSIADGTQLHGLHTTVYRLGLSTSFSSSFHDLAKELRRAWARL